MLSQGKQHFVKRYQFFYLGNMRVIWGQGAEMLMLPSAVLAGRGRLGSQPQIWGLFPYVGISLFGY